MHIYVHVPFCARRCSYCDFAIAVRRETPDLEFVAAILREWAGAVGRRSSSTIETIDTLYFGGGTPSRLAPESIAALIAGITAARPLARDAEVTLEANPDDVTHERAVGWFQAGVNRVSLGVQSHDPAVLEWMHRTHRVEQVAPALGMLRDAGITNISVDLIFALPEALQRDWRDDLDRTLALSPSHLSLYGLTIEPHTPLFRWTQRGMTSAPPDDRYADEYLLAHELLIAAGFEHYEVSNAGRPGYRARHNSAYWSGADYLGLGPSAHSFEQGVRRWNTREWSEYRDRLAAAGEAVAGTEMLDDEARRLEQRYLGLRTDRGLDIAEVRAETAAAWCGAGWARVSNGNIQLSAEGWLRLDALVAAAQHF